MLCSDKYREMKKNTYYLTVHVVRVVNTAEKNTTTKLEAHPKIQSALLNRSIITDRGKEVDMRIEKCVANKTDSNYAINVTANTNIREIVGLLSKITFAVSETGYYKIIVEPYL